MDVYGTLIDALESADEDLRLDPNALEENWMEQPQAYAVWSDRLAEARRLVDVAKEEAKAKEAAVGHELRDTLRNTAQKVIESKLASEVLLDPRVRGAKAEVAKFQYLVHRLSGVVEALNHRRAALEGLGRLMSMEYWSPPRGRSMREVQQERRAAKRFQRGK